MPEYRAAIADLEKQGGKVEVLGEESDEPRLVIAFPNKQATDSHMELVKRLKVSSLDLKNSKVTDRGLQDLSPQITDAGLEHIKDLGVFRVLDVKGTSVTAPGIKKLQQAVPTLRIDG